MMLRLKRSSMINKAKKHASSRSISASYKTRLIAGIMVVPPTDSPDIIRAEMHDFISNYNRQMQHS